VPLASVVVGFPSLINFNTTSSFFWDVTQRILVVSYRLLGQPIGPVFGSSYTHTHIKREMYGLSIEEGLIHNLGVTA
jgi:hypothetical protein